MLLLVACYVPTVVGLRTDGLLAPPGRGEAAIVAGEMLNGLDTEEWPYGPGYGFTGHYTFDDGLAAAISGARYGTLNGLDGELRVRVVDEARAPMTAVLLAGGGGVWSESSPTVGAHVGMVVGRGVGGNIRVYGGGRINPVIANSEARFFAEGSAGASWRPPVRPTVTGLFQFEGTWVHGSRTGGSGEDVDAYVVLGQIGLGWR